MINLLIEHFTYLGTFLTLLLGGLGLPVPEEIPIVAAGVLSHQGVLRWWIALPVCIAGALAGDTLLYLSGRRWGEHVLERRAVRHILSRDREERLKAAYRQHGVKVVFTARHVMGLRAAAFLTAGIAGVPFGKFLGADAAAAVFGVSVGFGVAYLFTDHVARLMADAHRIERWIGLLALIAFIAWLAAMISRRSRNI
jgi:membrane protein DedA with SNARE-associated domain